MKFEHIKIKNFRQYYGDQKVYFSKSNEQNVTIIHGENGFGKTAFLNALQWCLYGKITLPDPDILISERAESVAVEGAGLQVLVELRFRDSNKDYTVTRKSLGVKRNGRFDPRNETFTVSYIDEAGRSKESKNPQVTIDQILPSGMAPYFFFDGERIDQMGGRDGAKEIQEAIKNIMGLELLERGVAHLKDVQKIFSKELEDCGSQEIQEQLKRKREFEGPLKAKEEEKQNIDNNIEALSRQKETLEEKLRRNQETKELQNEKDNLVKRKSELQGLISAKENEIRELCSRRGFLAFSKPLIDKVSDEIERRRVKGEIPSGIKQQFVIDLLDLGVCICERCLDEGTESYESVRKWLDKSGDKDLEDAFSQTCAYIKLLEELRTELFVSLRMKRGELEELLSRLESLDEQLDQIDAKLDGKDSEEIHSLHSRCIEIEAEIPRQHVALGEVCNQINTIKKNMYDIDLEIEKIKVKEGKADTAKRRMHACNDAKDIIGEIYTQVAKTVRSDCQAKISEIYSQFLKKPYKAILQENYELNIVKTIGEEERSVALSQGERQVTSLSFIGALVHIAKRNYEEKKKFYFGGIYPIVMDSPFGQLDPEHRKNIAEGIPTLAPQVVLMVAKQQWSDEIRTALAPRVGKEYTLQNFNPKNDPDITYEYTQIVEGGYGK